jgi:hypothetical protein
MSLRFFETHLLKNLKYKTPQYSNLFYTFAASFKNVVEKSITRLKIFFSGQGISRLRFVF